MAYKHIRADDTESLDLGGIVLQNLFSESGAPFSVSKVALKGDQKESMNSESDIAYYVLDGNGSFFIGSDEIQVKQGDLIYIPKGTRYRDQGNLSLLAIACPRFNAQNHTYFD